jgi:hypothetical protein
MVAEGSKVKYSTKKSLVGLVVFVLFFGTLTLSFFHPHHAFGVARTWDGGCGANTNWSCAANWSGDVVPAAADTATFDNTSDNNSTIDSLFNATETISSITINSGYDGTITQATTIHVTTALTIHAGSYTASNQTLDINGATSLTLDGGSFTASNGSTTLAGSLTISGSPTFNANSGTFTFDGASTVSLSCNNVTFNRVTFAHTSGTKTVSSNCSMPLGNNPNANSGGSITLNGTLSGTGTLTTSGTFTVNSSAPLSGFTALTTSTVNISGGTFTAPSGTFTVSSAFTLNSAVTWSANGGTISFTGTGGIAISCGSKTLNLVTFARTSGTTTINNDCTFPMGNNPTMSAGATVTLNGTISGTGTLTTLGLTINSGAVLSGFSGYSGSLTNSGATIDFSSYTSWSGSMVQNSGTTTMPTVGATLVQLSLSTGTFNASSGTLSISTTLNILAATTFNADGGTININGTTNTPIVCNNKTFNLVTFTHTAGTKTVDSTCSLPLGSNPTLGSSSAAVTLNGTLSGSGTLTALNTFTVNSSSPLSGFSTLSAATLSISGGSFTAPTTMNVSNTFTLNSGVTWSANSGTVNFTGSAATLSCGSKAFNLVTISATSTNVKTVSSDCSLPLGTNPTITRVALSGTLSGSGTLTLSDTTGGHTFNSTAALSGFSGLNSPNSMTMTGPTIDFSSYTSFTMGSTYSQTGGSITLPSAGATFSGQTTINTGSTFTASSGTTTFTNDLTINSGATFNHNSGTVEFGGSSAANISCGNKTFNLVTFTHTSIAKTVGSDCTLPLGNNPTVGSGTTADVTVSGQLSGSGTLTVAGLAAGNVLTLNSATSLSGFSGLNAGSVTVSGAAINFSSYSPFSTNAGSLVLSSGASFTAPTGIMSVGRDITFNSGTTFNANGGTLNLVSGPGTLSCNNAVFNLVTISFSSGQKNINSDCTLPLGNNPTVGAPIQFAGGRFTGSGIITFNLGLGVDQVSNLSDFSGIIASSSFIVLTSATFDASGFSPLTISQFTMNTGSTFKAPPGTMSVSSTFLINSGTTFNANGGTVNFSGTTSASLTCNNATFNLVTFTHTSSTKTINSNCSLPLGNDPTLGIGGNITLNGGTLNGSGTASMPSGTTLTLSSTPTISGFTGLSLDSLTISSSATANLGSIASVSTNLNFVINPLATFTAPSTLSIGKNMSILSSATFNANGGTLNFNNTFDGIIICGGATFNLVTFTHTSGIKDVVNDCTLPLGSNPTAGNGGDIILEGTLTGTGTLTTTGTFTQVTGSSLSGFSGLESTNYTNAGTTTNFGSYNTFDVDGDFNLQSSATYTATAANMTVGGNFTVESGSTFTHNNGTVILDGSDQTVEGTAFYNLNKTAASNATLTITAGNTETIAGTLTLKGTSPSAMLTIVSSTPGTYWNLSAAGVVNMQYVALSDANNLGALITLSLCDSIDNGHNVGFVFAACGGGGDSGGSGGASSGSASTTTTAATSSSLLNQIASATPSGDVEVTPSEVVTPSSQASPSHEQKDSGETTKKSNHHTFIILFAAIGLLLLFLILLARRRKLQKAVVASSVIQPEPEPKKPDKFIN